MIDRPLHLQVDKRIVSDIEREGDFTKKAVDSRRARARDTTACADADNEWEYHEDDDGIVDAIRPHQRAFIASEARHAQHSENQQRTPPETAAQTDEPIHARKQQSAEEWEEQTGETYLQMLWLRTPTSYDSVAHLVGTRYVLDLGEVKNLARVFVNGKEAAHLWKKPFRCDVTDYLNGKANVIEIDVTNLWVNRMIGDEQEPDDTEWSEPFVYDYAPGNPEVGRFMKSIPQWLSAGSPRPSKGRRTVVSFKFFKKTDSLLPSGLLGPVRMLVLKKRP